MRAALHLRWCRGWHAATHTAQLRGYSFHGESLSKTLKDTFESVNIPRSRMVCIGLTRVCQVSVVSVDDLPMFVILGS